MLEQVDSCTARHASLLVIVQEFSILFFFDGGLHLVECLFDELAVLDVQNSIGIAFDLWVVGNHDARGCTVLALSLRPDSVDVEDQVHDGH